MQKILLDLWNIAQPVLMVLASLFAMWLARKYGVQLDAATQNQLQDQVRKAVGDGVAYIYQRSVKDLKDPTKPGEFDTAAKSKALQDVMSIVRTMHGEKLSSLSQYGIDVDKMLETMIERSVIELEARVTGTLAAPGTTVRANESPAQPVVVAVSAAAPGTPEPTPEKKKDPS